MKLYTFEVNIVVGKRIVPNLKPFQANNDDEAKKSGDNKWRGKGPEKRTAKLYRGHPKNKEVIRSWTIHIP